ncbi:hypothetical protein EVA_09090 [gut metagenome]|uniref:Uncharacterized protein n=1 Tax=gut metagenome TaxID=749906 RepID=J9GRL8_9ZZZZ
MYELKKVYHEIKEIYTIFVIFSKTKKILRKRCSKKDS